LTGFRLASFRSWLILSPHYRFCGLLFEICSERTRHQHSHAVSERLHPDSALKAKTLSAAGSSARMAPVYPRPAARCSS